MAQITQKVSQSSTNSPNKSRSVKRPLPRTDNLLESLRDIGNSTTDGLKKDVIQGIPQEFFRQMFGFERPSSKASGEIMPGQSIKFDQVIDEQREENVKLRNQLSNEQRLRAEEQAVTRKQGQELKLQLHALVGEVEQLAKSTQGLANETQIAAQQAPANPGIYHVNFFDRLRTYIQSFRKRIESASVWMQSFNQRAAKKRGFWGQVGKSGAKRLLSQEDYTQRSAG